MTTKFKIAAAAILFAAISAPALASDPTFDQYYANSGTYFNYLAGSPQDAFAQATDNVRINEPSFIDNRSAEPATLQMQRWYDRQSAVY